MATELEIMVAFDALAAGFPHYSPKPETIRAYCEDLCDLPGPAVYEAARRLRKTCGDYFPSITAWREAAVEVAEEQSGEIPGLIRLSAPDPTREHPLPPDQVSKLRELTDQISAKWGFRLRRPNA